MPLIPATGRSGCRDGVQPDISLASINYVQAASDMNPVPGVPVASAAMERDADLIALLRTGDHHAVLRGLMERYRQKVLHLAVSLVRDPALAEDLAQTAFVKIWQALPRYDGRAALSTWLYIIARNTCLTAVARERRTVSLEGTGMDAAIEEAGGGSTLAGSGSASQIAAEYDVAKLLERLPEPYRRVVVLFYLEDRSCEEVGALLGMPSGTVKALLHRGRNRLAALAGAGTEEAK
jgi:RNA polymerase sigma-70 factor (ECF subfamily)